MKRSAGAYLRPECLIIQAEARMRAGIRVATTPVWRLPPETSAAEIGAVLRSALSAFRGDEPNLLHGEQKVMRAAFLRQAGFRSWRSLENGARSCWIEEHDGILVLTPLRNGGTKGATKGFQPFGVEPLTSPGDVGEQAMGQLLLDAWARSE